MKVHNKIEDLVLETVHDIFDDMSTSGSVCTCSQCRMDVACYVLNRMGTEYVVSSRGIAHMEADYHTNMQKVADVVTLVNEGVDVVSKSMRPNFEHQNQTTQIAPEGPVFSFPIISGRIFDGQNFSPMTSKKVILYIGDEEVGMVDNNWLNPYDIVDAFPGNFMFWPKPLSAKKVGEEKIFNFTIKLDDPSYKSFSHNIDLPIVAGPVWQNALDKNLSHNIHDLHIFSDDMDDGLVP